MEVVEVSRRLLTSLIVVVLALYMARTTVSTVVRGRCWVRCGLISEPRSSTGDQSTPTSGAGGFVSFVSSVWDDLRYAKSISGIDFQFVRINRRDDMAMDTLIAAYMELGTANVSAIFGPYRQALLIAAQKFGLPYVVVDPDSVAMTTAGTPYESMLPAARPYNLISVLPHPHDLYSVVLDVLQLLRWPNVAVIYEHNTDGVRLIEDLVRMPHIHVGAWKLDNVKSPNDDIVKDALLQVRHLAITNVILMTSRSTAEHVLDMALHLSMLSHGYCWFLTAMDLDEAVLRRYAFTQVNLTSLRLQRSRLPNGEYTARSQYAGVPEYAVVYDSLLSLYHGIRQHYRNVASCQWSGKEHILPTLAKINDVCATGELTFREDGTRQGYVINIYALSTSGLVQLGFWNSSNSDTKQRLTLDYSLLRNRADLTDLRHRDVSLGKFHVVTLMEAPYAMLHDADGSDSGHAAEVPVTTHRYHGYAVDLLDALARSARFTYSLHVINGVQRGHRQPGGNWTGLIGQLINGNASLAVGPLTATVERQESVDFTHVFQTVTISAVVSRHFVSTLTSASSSTAAYGNDVSMSSLVSRTFQFVQPLSTSVWFLLLAVLCTVSIVLYVVDHLTSGSGSGAASSAGTTDSTTQGQGHVQGQAISTSQRQGVGQTVWLAVTTMFLMTSSTSSSAASAPRATQATVFVRLTVTALWCFSMFLVTSYSANMAAILTSKQLIRRGVMAEKTLTVSALLRLPSPKWRFVTVAGGDVSALLSTSDGVAHYDNDVIKYFRQKSARWTFVESVEAGIRAVVDSDDVMFIYDRGILLYQLNEQFKNLCAERLSVVPLDSSDDDDQPALSYGIAVPRRFPHTSALNLALLRLQRDGTLNVLKHKWFDAGNSECSKLGGSSELNQSSALTVSDLGGLFLSFAVVIAGILISSVTCHCLRHIRATQNHVTVNANRSKRTENHVATAVASGSILKHTSAGPGAGSVSTTACNSRPASTTTAPVGSTAYDILQIEQFTDSTVCIEPTSSSSLALVANTPSARLRNCSLASAAKETNF